MTTLDARVKETRDRADSLERRVFGTPPTDSAGLIAFRDAQERARQLTRDDEGQKSAREYLKQAKLSSDQQLASAILGVALANGWTEVVNEFREMYPELASALDDLVEIRSYKNDARAQVFLSTIESS